jgi:hypothetical protein
VCDACTRRCCDVRECTGGGCHAADPDTHTRACAFKCAASGFGVLTKDQQFLKFDAAGDAKIVEALKASGAKDHLRVNVEGNVQGDTLKVTSIKLL